MDDIVSPAHSYSQATSASCRQPLSPTFSNSFLAHSLTLVRPTLDTKVCCPTADIPIRGHMSMMSTDEIQVYELLKEALNVSVSAREIARRLGGRKRLKQDPDWIQPVLTRMILAEMIETDERGDYRIRVRASSNLTPQKLTMENWQTWQLILDDREKRDE